MNTLPGIWWHGSPKRFERFVYEFLGTGRGYDQEGPGFYLTSERSDAANYGGHLYQVRASAGHLLPLQGEVGARWVRWMLQQAPNLRDTLSNWHENRSMALHNALHAMLNHDSPHEVFQSVWYDFYRGNEAQYLKNMVLIGYDGVLLERKDGIRHPVVFSPDALTIEQVT